MSMPVVLRPIAHVEAYEAARWYEVKQEGLGAEFLLELQRVLDVIGNHPNRYPLVLKDTREVPLARFPYCVYYRERLGQVVITAVFHTSRDPSDWRGRS